MQIEHLEIRNYRVFRHAVLSDLPRMAVVVGANGSGKSTLFDVFSFLKDAVAQDAQAAVDRRGGFGELVSRNQTGPISIKVGFRESGGRLATYELKLESDSGQVFVVSETLLYQENDQEQPRHLLDFESGIGTAIVEEPVQDQGAVAGESQKYIFDDPSVPGHHGARPLRQAPHGLGSPQPDRELAHFQLPHRGRPPERRGWLRRAPFHPW